MSLAIGRLTCMDTLRGFVAVGRRMSITLAAEDLFLTQSAVSRQVHALEESLGVKLFERHHRALSFTPAGERLFRSADGALQQLQDAVGAITGAGASTPVTISASVGIAALWLLPRLGGFQEQHPRVDVRIASENRIADPGRDGVDIALRYCASDRAPKGSIHLFDETVAPVASPALGHDSLEGALAGRGRPLLEFDDARRPWLQWGTRLAGTAGGAAKARSMIRFNQYDQVIHAAIAGQGIALGRLELLGHFFERNQLRLLRERRAVPKAAHAFWLVRSEATPRADARRVADWIVGEAGKVRQRLAS